MEVWKTAACALCILIPAAATGCQFSDGEGGLHLSRMIPRPVSAFGEVPPQSEPEIKQAPTSEIAQAAEAE